MEAYLSPVKDFNMLLFFILCYLLDTITSFDFQYLALIVFYLVLSLFGILRQ